MALYKTDNILPDDDWEKEIGEEHKNLYNIYKLTYTLKTVKETA